nr:olfactory receptor 1 [Gregopimpla kuwanae]
MFPSSTNTKCAQAHYDLPIHVNVSDHQSGLETSCKFVQLDQESDQQDFKSDASFAVHLSRRYLKVLGIWRSDDQFFWRLITNISMLICYFGLGMSVVPTFIFIAVKVEDPIGKIRLIGPWSFCLMAALKYYFLRSHRCDIENCMKNIELDWIRIEYKSRRDVMLEHARYGHLVTMICAGFTYSGGLLFAILPFVLGNLGPFEASNGNISRSHSLPSHFVFFDASETPAYEIIYFIQVITTFMMHSITVASYSVAVVIVMHACGQLKLLMDKITQLVENEDGKKERSLDDRMSDVISHHVRTLRFISSAERMLREICLVDLGGCTLNLCFLGYFTLLEWGAEKTDFIAIMTYLTLFTSFLFNVFSFCYIGELLTGECAKVGEITYMIDWYRLPSKKSVGLCLVIAMAHSPVTLTAGGAIQLSFACFASVVKTSMGYLNMLRAVMV